MKIAGIAGLFFLASVIGSCIASESSSRTRPAKKGYACATIGNVVLEFPSAYQFFPLTYEGIDYWRGEASKHWEKGCDDRASQIALSTAWPDLKPPAKRFYETSNDPDLISIVVDTNKSTNPSLAMESMRNYYISPESKVADDKDTQRYRSQKFPLDASLGLFKAGPIQGAARYQKFAYWSAGKESGIETLILCKSYPTGAIDCEEKRFSEKLNVWISVKFREPLLAKWQDMAHESETLITSLIKKD